MEADAQFKPKFKLPAKSPGMERGEKETMNARTVRLYRERQRAEWDSPPSSDPYGAPSWGEHFETGIYAKPLTRQPPPRQRDLPWGKRFRSWFGYS